VISQPAIQLAFCVLSPKCSEFSHQPGVFTKQLALERVVFAEAGDRRKECFAFDQQKQRAQLHVPEELRIAGGTIQVAKKLYMTAHSAGSLHSLRDASPIFGA
jgi:hypothetical protein